MHPVHLLPRIHGPGHRLLLGDEAQPGDVGRLIGRVAGVGLAHGRRAVRVRGRHQVEEGGRAVGEVVAAGEQDVGRGEGVARGRHRIPHCDDRHQGQQVGRGGGDAGAVVEGGDGAGGDGDGGRGRVGAGVVLRASADGDVG